MPGKKLSKKRTQALSKALNQYFAKVMGYAKVGLQWGFMPTLIFIGMNTEPNPT